MNEPQSKPSLTRRSLLAASAATAATVGAVGLPVLQTAAPALAHGKLRVEPLIPQRNRGIILFSVRDRIGAAPDDSGVPYGFERVLARLAEIGYKEIEFAGYNQHTSILGRQITPAEIRRILDDNGLVANGTHTQINPATFEQQLDIAETLGMKHIGEQSYHHANWEQDTAPGGAANPGQSLAFAQTSYTTMSELTIYRH